MSSTSFGKPPHERQQQISQDTQRKQEQARIAEQAAAEERARVEAEAQQKAGSHVSTISERPKPGQTFPIQGVHATGVTRQGPRPNAMTGKVAVVDEDREIAVQVLHSSVIFRPKQRIQPHETKLLELAKAQGIRLRYV